MYAPAVCFAGPNASSVTASGVPILPSGAALLLGVVLLCGVAESFLAAAAQPAVPQVVPMAGALAITLIAAGDFQRMMGLGVETMEELDIFAKALLPTLSAAVAASGGIASASAKQVATVFFTNLLLTVIRRLLLPLLYGCIAAACRCWTSKSCRRWQEENKSKKQHRSVRKCSGVVLWYGVYQAFSEGLLRSTLRMILRTGRMLLAFMDNSSTPMRRKVSVRAVSAPSSPQMPTQMPWR